MSTRARKINVRIFGLIGENLGDEALGIAAYDFLKTKLGNSANIEIGEVVKGRAERNNVSSFLVDRKSVTGIWQIIKNIWMSDVVLVGGGSLIQDKIGISLLRGTLPYIFQVSLVAFLFGKKVISLPMGVDHLNTRLGKLMAYICLKCIDGVYVRDKASQANAMKYGVLKEESVHVVPDPAFLYERVGDDVYQQSLTVPDQKYAIIALAKEKYEEESYIEALLCFCKYMDEKKIKIKLVAMDEKEQEDPHLNGLIIERVRKVCDAECIPTGISLANMVALLRNAEVVVAMRLHAVILAYGYTKLIMISRTTKTDALMRDYDVKGVSLQSKILGKEDIFSVYKRLTGDDKSKGLNRVKDRASSGLHEIAEAILG